MNSLNYNMKKRVNILFADARWTFQPISGETNSFVGFLAFFSIVPFRMLVWIVIIITIEKFSIVVCAGKTCDSFEL